jgi:hypothetical protein
MLNETQIGDIWLLFKEYIDKKVQDAAAERFVDLMADHGVSDKVFEDALGSCDMLDDAINYYLDKDSDDEEPEYYEEDEDY